MVTKPRRRAVVPSPAFMVVSNGLTVTPLSSMRTTSPSWGLPAGVELYALAQLDERREARNTAEGGSNLE